MKKVITYGTFDLLTPGHIEQLRESKKLGDYLIVGVSTDEFNQIKGKKSYLTYEERKEIMESIKYVDEVIPEEHWDQKVDDIKKYGVSILTMGEDWKGSDKFEYLKEYCDVVFIPRSFKYSSTNYRDYVSKHKDDNSKKNKLKRKLKRIFLYTFKYHLKFIYFFIKLFTKRRKNRVFLLSRQYNFLPINYKEFIHFAKKQSDNKLKFKYICKKMESTSKIKYYFLMYKQMYYAATSKVIIVDGYNPVVSILKHKKDTKVIQMWHALGAIKKFGYQTLLLDSGRDYETAQIMDMHKNYDTIISGSKAMIPFFSEAFRTEESKFVDFGTPSIDYLLKKEVDKKEIYKKYKFLKGKTVITYSPTFRSDGRNYVDKFIDEVDLKKYALIVTVHPSDITKLEKREGVLYNPDINFFDLVKFTDYFVTDYSAAMLDACVVKTKLLLYVNDYHLYEKENGMNINLFEELPGYVSKEASDLMKVIDSNKYDMKVLEHFRNKYITNSDGTSTKKLYDLVNEYMK